MQIRPDLNNCNGTILIVTLWILVILTLFSIAVGQRASLEIKLGEYQRDRLRASELSRAAIARAICEKINDRSEKIDALSESWASNQPAFKNFELGEGSFSVNFSLDGVTLYGMEDEESRININKIDQEVLLNLLEDCGLDYADELAHSILVWCGKIDDPEEESNYDDLPYDCKKEEFKSVAELLLVRQITPQILYGEDRNGNGRISPDETGIAGHLTVYGQGSANINTATEKVLSALTGDAELAGEIARYRAGADEKIGTDDDGWFRDNSSKIDTNAPYGEIKNLDDPDAGEPFNQLEWNKLRSLKVNKLLSVSSNTYTIRAHAEVKKAKRSITATIDLSEPGEPRYLFWHNK